MSAITKEQAIERLANLSFKMVNSSLYINTNTRMIIKCDIHDIEWESTIGEAYRKVKYCCECRKLDGDWGKDCHFKELTILLNKIFQKFCDTFAIRFLFNCLTFINIIVSVLQRIMEGLIIEIIVGFVNVLNVLYSKHRFDMIDERFGKIENQIKDVRSEIKDIKDMLIEEFKKNKKE